MFKAQKIIDADLDNKNEINNASPVFMSSKLRNLMKSMAYLKAHSKGEVKNKMDAIEPIIKNLKYKQQCTEKYQIIFHKLNKCFVKK